MELSAGAQVDIKNTVMYIRIVYHSAAKVRGMGSRGSGILAGDDVASLQQQLQEMKDKARE